MKVYDSANVRNVALVGHHGAGKTTLTEALLHVSGATTRMGRIEDGNTVCDFDEEEHKRGMSLSVALAPVEWANTKINVLDTPGYADFVGDVAAALEVADLAVFVVSGVEGIGVQTEIAWQMAEERRIPRAFFVTKLDREHASFETVVDALKGAFGTGVAPLQLPIGAESSLRGVVNLLAEKAYTYASAGGIATEDEIPGDMADREHQVHDQLVEGIVVADDDLMERYLNDEQIEIAELKKALAVGIADGTVFPVLCGSATGIMGIDRLASFIVEEAPAPSTPNEPSAAYAFKTIADPYLGRVNLVRVLSGGVAADQHLTNLRSSANERFHQIFTLRGNTQLDLESIAPGDIAAVAKLADTSTGDVLTTPGHTPEVDRIASASPVLSIAIRARNKGDEDKLANALHKLLDEDPALVMDRNAETHQTLLSGQGDTHLAIALERLERKFGVAVETEDVRVAYRETVSGAGEAEGKYKKQTGGHGQYGVASLRVEPLPRGDGFEFVDKIVGGAIPRQFIPAVEKGIVETMQRGGALGFPVVDIRVTCFDGKYHSVDSSEQSFRMAGSIGFKSASEAAKPLLLEPISDLVITVPEANQGDVMGDLNAKRGRITGTAAVGRGEVEITAQAPTAEIQRYAIDLRSMTHGRGRFTIAHSHYDPVPTHLVDRISASAGGPE